MFTCVREITAFSINSISRQLICFVLDSQNNANAIEISLDHFKLFQEEVMLIVYINPAIPVLVKVSFPSHTDISVSSAESYRVLHFFYLYEKQVTWHNCTQ